MAHRYTVVDVFGAAALGGNPLAVVHDADDLDDARMQAIARWTNLSETTFLLRPTDPAADYRVRIFTPAYEMPFAGHPTLGSAFAWQAAGGTPARPGRWIQQCGIGCVTVRADGPALAFAAPPLTRSAPDAAELGAVLAALGLAPDAVVDVARLNNGPVWLGIVLRDAATVLALRPDFGALARLPKVGVIGAHRAGEDCAFEVRGFAPAGGINEDPVTGSLNASLAQWLTDTGRAPERYVVAQGTQLGRTGRVQVSREPDGRIWIGGPCTAVVTGTIAA